MGGNFYNMHWSIFNYQNRIIRVIGSRRLSESKKKLRLPADGAIPAFPAALTPSSLWPVKF